MNPPPKYVYWGAEKLLKELRVLIEHSRLKCAWSMPSKIPHKRLLWMEPPKNLQGTDTFCARIPNRAAIDPNLCVDRSIGLGVT